MIANVFFFGATADIVGQREIEAEIDDSSSVNSVLKRLLRNHPRLSNHKLLIAINEEYADADTLLKNGDEIAIFTAVSGG